MNVKRQMWDELMDSCKKCTGCGLHEHAKKKVTGKGSLSPQVLFVGEGPGRTEDVVGIPFVGQAGRLLDAAIIDTNVPVKSFFTNLVSCRPCDGPSRPNRPPNDNEVNACKHRLRQTVRILSPRVVVLLGRVPRMALVEEPFLKHYRKFCLDHPAYILRQGGIKGPLYPSYVAKLKEVFHVAVQP